MNLRVQYEGVYEGVNSYADNYEDVSIPDDTPADRIGIEAVIAFNRKRGCRAYPNERYTVTPHVESIKVVTRQSDPTREENVLFVPGEGLVV